METPNFMTITCTRIRSRLIWEDNIKMDLQEVGWEWAWTGLIWLTIGTGGGHL
jgi:hypothetical protein